MIFECKSEDSEPGWNEQIHSRVLELALKDQAGVRFQEHVRFAILTALQSLVISSKIKEQYNRKNPPSRSNSQERQRNSTGEEGGGGKWWAMPFASKIVRLSPIRV